MLDEPIGAVFSLISASVKLDAEEDMKRIAFQQVSGQISKKQSQSAEQMRGELKRQASDILEPKETAPISSLKRILGGK